MGTLLTSNLDTGLSYHRNIVRECTKGLCHLAEGRWAAMEYGPGADFQDFKQGSPWRICIR